MLNLIACNRLEIIINRIIDKLKVIYAANMELLLRKADA